MPTYRPFGDLCRAAVARGLLRDTLLLSTLLLGAAACGDAPLRVAAGATSSESSEQSAPPTTAAPTASDTRVAFLGDSISAGLHLAADQAFPAIVQRRLAAKGLRFELMNGGVSGDTTAGGLRRVDWLLKRSPRVVVIELGGNDGMRGVPVDSIEANLRAIIAKVTAAHARVLLLGMRIPPSYGPEYVTAFEAMYPRLARELALPFVPFFMEGVAGRSELNLPDGIHPTPAGHEKLADAVAAPLEKLLAQQ
jgi:acyl-CoA thioesterase I